jgi:hypothetical protein
MWMTCPGSADAAANVNLMRDRGHEDRERKPSDKEKLEDAVRHLASLLEEVKHEEGKERHAKRRHEFEIQESMERLQQLRMEQVDLQAALQHAELDGKLDRVHDLQKAMISIEHEVQRGELELQQVIMERERDAERRDLLRMTDRLEYVASWRDVAFDSAQAVLMATQAVVEIHLAQNDPKRAAETLEELLLRIAGTGSRTAIRFALKDLYMELELPDRAVEHMLQIIVENSPTHGE